MNACIQISLAKVKELPGARSYDYSSGMKQINRRTSLEVTDQIKLSSLRSLVLLMSHGKPRMSSFFSSNAAPPPGNCTPAAPTVQPPADPALPDCSSHKCPPHEEFVIHPLPDPPKKGNALNDKTSASNLRFLFTVDKDPKHPALPEPERDSCSSHNCRDHEEFVPRPHHGDPCGAAEDVADKPLLYAVDEDPKYPILNDGSCSRIPDPRLKPSEDVKHPLPDPPRRP